MNTDVSKLHFLHDTCVQLILLLRITDTLALWITWVCRHCCVSVALPIKHATFRYYTGVTLPHCMPPPKVQSSQMWILLQGVLFTLKIMWTRVEQRQDELRRGIDSATSTANTGDGKSKLLYPNAACQPIRGTHCVMYGQQYGSPGKRRCRINW